MSSGPHLIIRTFVSLGDVDADEIGAPHNTLINPEVQSL